MFNRDFPLSKKTHIHQYLGLESGAIFSLLPKPGSYLKRYIIFRNQNSLKKTRSGATSCVYLWATDGKYKVARMARPAGPASSTLLTHACSWNCQNVMTGTLGYGAGSPIRKQEPWLVWVLVKFIRQVRR
jgi:hypothetical protein